MPDDRSCLFVSIVFPRHTMFETSSSNPLVHLDVFGHSSLLSKAQPSTLDDLSHPKYECHSPRNRVQRTDYRTRARNVADLTISANLCRRCDLTVRTYGAKTYSIT